jgi:plasmid stabilization system protein ParE
MGSSDPRWHSGAVKDALVARDWYSKRSPLAARGFLVCLEGAVTAVSAAPTRWPAARHGCRRYVFPNQYPYSLVYRQLDDGTIEIVAVAHQKRRPEYWQDR